jgi:hypothetical protein
MILVDIILCGTGGMFWISDFKNELIENVIFADGRLNLYIYIYLLFYVARDYL